MKKIIIFYLWFLLTLPLLGQPGPPRPAKLIFKKVYDKNLQPIDYQELNVFRNGTEITDRVKQNESVSVSMPFWEEKSDITRLTIIYQNQQYVFDFEGRISDPDDQIGDSLVLSQPYLLQKRVKKVLRRYGINGWNNTSMFHFVNKFFKNGVTPYTNRILGQWGFVYFDEKMKGKMEDWETYYYCQTPECKDEDDSSYKSLPIKEKSVEKSVRLKGNYAPPMLDYHLDLLRDINTAETALKGLKLLEEYPNLLEERVNKEYQAFFHETAKQYEQAYQMWVWLRADAEKRDDATDIHIAERYKQKLLFKMKNFKQIRQDLKVFAVPNITHLLKEDNDFYNDSMVLFFFVHSLAAYLDEPTLDHLNNLNNSLFWDESAKRLDASFLKYLITDYLMHSPEDEAHFQALRLILIYINSEGNKRISPMKFPYR